MSTTKFQFNDGGRAAAGYTGTTGDCVCRAIAIVTGKPYQEVYDLINTFSKSERTSKRKKQKSNARTGVYKDSTRKIMLSLGWKWIPTMQIGSGCTVHLRADQLPGGTILVNVSRHSVAVIDGVIHDTHDCSRGGMRCVYGYYSKEEAPEEVEEQQPEIKEINLTGLMIKSDFFDRLYVEVPHEDGISTIVYISIASKQ